MGLSIASLYIPAYAFAALLPLVILFIVALAFHWNFPEIVQPLMQLAEWAMRRKEDASPPAEDEE